MKNAEKKPSAFSPHPAAQSDGWPDPFAIAIPRHHNTPHPAAQSDGWPDRVFCCAVRLYPSDSAVQSARGVN